jgi:ferritin
MILSANMLTLLSAQYSHEIANSLAYTAMQSWAEMRGLNGTACFFKKAGSDERDHADMILAYIHDRNEQLDVQAVALHPSAADNFLGQFMAAQVIERMTTDLIANIRDQAEAERDMMTCAWLAAPAGLILEQVEEENIIQTILDRISARMGNVSLDGSDVTPAETPGAVIHDIDAWLGGL